MTFSEGPLGLRGLPELPLRRPRRALSPRAASPSSTTASTRRARPRVPVEISPRGPGPPASLKANLLARVFEPSGVFSSETSQVDFHPYSRYVGIRLPQGDGYMGALATDKSHKVDIALVDRDGKPVKSGRVQIALYRPRVALVVGEGGRRSLTEVARDLYSREVKKGTRSRSATAWPPGPSPSPIPPGAASSSGAVDVSDASRGNETSHATGSIVFIDWPYYAGLRAAATRPRPPCSPSRPTRPSTPWARPPGSASPSNSGGRALVAVETRGPPPQAGVGRDGEGEDGLRAPPHGGDGAQTSISHVSFIQPHLQTANDLPHPPLRHPPDHGGGPRHADFPDLERAGGDSAQRRTCASRSARPPGRP